MPGSRLDLARSLSSEGHMLKQTGDTARAAAAYEQAHAILVRLTDADPANFRYESELGRCENRVGTLLSRMGKPGQAMAAYDRARAIQQKLVGENPSNPTSRVTWRAPSKTSAGCSRVQASRHGRSQPTSRQWPSSRSWPMPTPQSREFQSELASSHANIGWLLLRCGQCRQGDRVAKEGPGDPAEAGRRQSCRHALPDALADSYFQIAKEFTRRDKPAEALTALRRARAILQKLADDNPTVPWFQSELAIALLNIGSVHQNEGRVTDATNAYRKTVALLEKPFARSNEVLYNLACGHARLAGLATIPGSVLSAAEGQAEADRAMSWLREAIANAFRNISLMRNDFDLDALRSRPDFQLLMMDLAMPTEVFAP